MKKKAKSILAVVVAILCFILLALSLTTNIVFSRSDTPKVCGYYVYMNEYDTMEAAVATGTTTAEGSVDVATAAASVDENSEAASIHQYTAVIAKAYDESDPIAKNNAILCRLAEDDASTDTDSTGIAVRRVLNIEQDETGILRYYPTTMQAATVGTEPSITVDNILGKCTFESGEIYSLVKFATNIKGIVLLLILPAVILVILLIVAITNASKNREEEIAYEDSYDEIYGEEDYGDEQYDDNLGDNRPLFRSNGETTSHLKAQQSTIQDNFGRKPVNPNSPYQKAKTQSFAAQRDVPMYVEPDTQTNNTPVYTEAPVQSEYQGSHGGTTSNIADFGVSTTTNVDPCVGPHAYQGSHAAGAPTKTTTSNVGNFGTSSKKSYEDSSVDDLIAMIENEKKKL